MTFLEVNTGEKVYRWKVERMPEGSGEAAYFARMMFLNKFLKTYSEVMAYALEGANIYIVHESKMNYGKNVGIAKRR